MAQRVTRKDIPTSPFASKDESKGCVLHADDPFEEALIRMAKTHAKKAADYAQQGDEFSNFVIAAEGMGVNGFSMAHGIEYQLRQKLARLTALRLNGTINKPENESVMDTFLDIAVYAVLLLVANTPAQSPQEIQTKKVSFAELLKESEGRYELSSDKLPKEDPWV